MGKVMIISFDSGEEQVIDRIMQLLSNEQIEVAEYHEESTVNSSKMKLFPRESRVEVDNRSLILGRRQFAVLLLLAKNPNRIFTKEEIYSYVWNDAVPINVEEAVRYHISDIRKKLSGMYKESFIETIWGIGYRFRVCE